MAFWWSSSEVFALNTDGTGFTNLYNFTPLDDVWHSAPYTNSDGGNANGLLVLSGNTLYGTAGIGGTNGSGTVFAVNTDGTGFTTLHSFTAPVLVNDTNILIYGFSTNTDGADPFAGLILSGNTLYGTAGGGGNSGYGTVFKLNTDGTGFTTLHSFTTISGSGDYYNYGPNSGGTGPAGDLILSGNALYGTAYGGGSSGNGTVFAVNTDGTGFTTLHSFTAPVLVNDTNSLIYGFSTNADGANPIAGLILSGNTLYGTAYWGGSSGNGTVFAVNTDGTGFTTLHSFTGGSDGANPVAGVILSGNTLYGTAEYGGTNSCGTVFSIFIQPQLTLIPSGPYVILTWPTNYAGFTLQSTTNLGSSAVWSTNSSPPVVIGGENVVINAASGKQQFYRLSQ
jgi:uncharacterized repeat protein (TIGR03803 family)